MQKKQWFFSLFLALLLSFNLLGVSTGSAETTSDKKQRMDADFYKLVLAYPEGTFKVVVQKDAKNKDLKDMEIENLVRQGGGQIKKQLNLILSFSAEMTGKEIEKLSQNPKVRWISPDAPMVSTGSGGLSTVLDSFKSKSYSGNDGSEKWANDWIEGDGNGDFTVSTVDSGPFLITNSTSCAGGSGYCLRVDPIAAGTYIYRLADLHSAASATLSFYRNNRLSGDTGVVELQISADAGVTWTSLRRYSSQDFSGSATDTFDITRYANQNTQIRFFITNARSNTGYILFDDIQIEYAIGSVYREVVGAEALWQQTGLDGQGVTIAVVDSGISDHMDLHRNANNPTQALNSSSRVIYNGVFGAYPSPDDEYAHGNHVAGIIGGNGVASGGKYKGIAPAVNLINIRVSSSQGLTCTSDVIEGLEWLFNNKATYNIRAVNLSINSTAPESYQNSPLDAAVEVLWFNGIVVVVAAGNNGTADGPSTVYPPANDPFVITVGAIEDRGTTSLQDDIMGTFSAYGTTPDGFAKPDLVAPGRNIISLLAGTTSTGYTGHPKHRVSDFYFRMTGTSMAAPVVTGAIALLLQDEPNLTPDQVKYRLLATANHKWPGYDGAKAGAGTVDVLAAVYGTTTNSANQGIVPSHMLATGENAVAFDSVGWNSVGWNSVG